MVIHIEDYYSPIKKRLETQGIEGICVDIDDTLSATNLFWANHHMRNFGNPETLTAEEIIKRYRYVSDVPYWGGNKTAEEWIIQNCESVDGRLDVQPINGALEGIKKIEGSTTLVAYLTGRTQHIVKGTKLWLAKHRFPNLDILAKPSQKTLEDMGIANPHEWKSRVLEFLFPQVRGIIEDNANLLHFLSPRYQGTVFLFSHNNFIDTSIDVICCPTWNDVVRHVQKQTQRYNESDQIRLAYDKVANDFLFTRTEGVGINGFGHREIEQPNMFRMVPQELINVKLLDLGCGPGIHACEYVRRGAEVVGVDLSSEMITLAKRTCPKAYFEKGNAYHLNYDDEHFDIVTSSLLMDHIFELDKLFKEIHRVLKSRGTFIFSIPHPILTLFGQDKDSRTNRSYFEETPHYFSVAGNPTKIKAYQHQLMKYFQVPLRNGFNLQEFTENQPNQQWQKDFENLDRSYLIMPQQCFFKWVKN